MRNSNAKAGIFTAVLVLVIFLIALFTGKLLYLLGAIVAISAMVVGILCYKRFQYKRNNR